VRQILSALGFCLLIISAVFIAIGVFELIRGDSKSEVSGLIGMVVLFIGTGIGGWKLVQANRSPPGCPTCRRRSFASSLSWTLRPRDADE